MIDLINEFSAMQIFTFSIFLVLAVKGIWDLVDYFKKKYQEKFNKDYDKKQKEEDLFERLNNYADENKEYAERYSILEEKIDNLINTVNDKFEDLDIRLDQLDNNDKHIMKQALVKDYHYFTDQGWIDDFSLDTILLLYDDYTLLGGNSYVHNLVEKIKQLPHHPAE